MNERIWLALGLGVAAFATYSLTLGQAPPVDPPARTINLGAGTAPVPAESPGTSATNALEPSKLSPLQRQMLLSAQRGADWLFRMNGVKGRFASGYVPALRADLDGDHYLRQAGAALALAQAARVLGEEPYAARATQAILTLLEETAVDPASTDIRSTTLPSIVVNRLGAAATLVLAIHELPAPQADLLDKAEQMCNYIRRQARADGSLCCGDDVPEKTARDSVEDMQAYPGLALYALVRSQKLRPADWKLDVVRKAASYYRPWWQSHKSLEFVPWHIAANAVAYNLTREKSFAEFVFEMSDWVAHLQYDQIDPRRLAWYGGFKRWTDGRTAEDPPQVLSAQYASGLTHGRRVARLVGDAGRQARYGDAVERGLQFLATLQFTDANTQHFADWYRPRLVGGFHASHQDGNLRIDYTQHAVSAFVGYLDSAAR